MSDLMQLLSSVLIVCLIAITVAGTVAVIGLVVAAMFTVWRELW